MEARGVLAEHSFTELLNLLEWFNRRGPIPTIIGGWAVFFYNSYLGSVDIDLVGYSMGGMFDQVIAGFERSQGYEEITMGPVGLGKSYRRRVVVDGDTVGFVEIDACSYESDLRVFHEDDDKELPYSLCSREGYTSHVDLGNGLEAFIPRKPLLFLYKLKAFRDRSYDLRMRGASLSVARREWLRAKRDKDGSDMIALLDPEPSRYSVEEAFDVGLFEEIVEEFDLYFALDSVGQLPYLRDSLEMYPKAKRDDVLEWVDLMSSQVSNG